MVTTENAVKSPITGQRAERIAAILCDGCVSISKHGGALKAICRDIGHCPEVEADVYRILAIADREA